jgi:acyl dehydratase
MGLYFEEFSVEQKVVTEKRTITENDIMTFATLSGDDNRIHTDPEFSKTTIFGKQIAHGLLGLSIASGLAWQTGIMDGTVMAFREVNEWKFVKPVFIGETQVATYQRKLIEQARTKRATLSAKPLAVTA